MPRKKKLALGEHTFYIPAGYTPQIMDFVCKTSVIEDKKLYLVKVLAFVDNLYVRVKHAKKIKAGVSIKRIHYLLGLDNSDCTLLLNLLQEHKIIFCDKSKFVAGKIPYSYGFVPLTEKMPGFERITVKKKDIRKSTMKAICRPNTIENEDNKLYYDEVISKLEITGINLSDFEILAGYEDILGKEENPQKSSKKSKNNNYHFPPIHYSGGCVPETENRVNTIFFNQKADGGCVPDEKTDENRLLYSGGCVPDGFITVTKVTDDKLLPLFRIHDKRFFCRPSYKHKDGRVYTNVTNFPKKFRKHLSIDGKRFIGIDIRNCQPLLAAILFMNYSMQVYGELKEDIVEYKRQCEDCTFYEYFMGINKIDQSEENRQTFKGKFFGECFYSKNAAEDKRKELSIQFQQKYPTCYEALVNYKGKYEYSPEYKQVPITLQAVEKSIIFGTNIELVKAGIKCFNIFDSLFFTSMDDLGKAREILVKKFSVWNIKPGFKIEDYTKDIDSGVSDAENRDENTNDYIDSPDEPAVIIEPESVEYTDNQIWEQLKEEYWYVPEDERKQTIDRVRELLKLQAAEELS